MKLHQLALAIFRYSDSVDHARAKAGMNPMGPRS